MTAPLSRDGLTVLHELMAAHVASGQMPGLVTLVARGDGILRVDQTIDDLVPELASRQVLRAVDAELDDGLRVGDGASRYASHPEGRSSARAPEHRRSAVASWRVVARTAHSVGAGGGARGSTDLALPSGFGWDGGSGTAWRSNAERGVTGILLTQRQLNSPQPRVFDDFWSGVNASTR